jgi:threonyl-tRNA synthetase
LKVQLIEEKTLGQAEVSCYTIKDKETFVDFCVGPHVPSTGKLKAFKLLSTSNAVLEGRRAQRADAAHLRNRVRVGQGPEGVSSRRSRKRRSAIIGSWAGAGDCSLFTMGARSPRSGSTKGTTLYNTLANYMREVLFPAGYVEVKTPLVYNKALWERSGHWAHYKTTCSSSNRKARR